jgi:hypothetical protein
LFTSVVRTVPGTVAAYQPAALNPAEETSAPVCGALATSCNCQPELTTRGGGGAAFGAP